MAKLFKQLKAGATSKPFPLLMADFVSFVREMFVQSSMILGIFAVMGIDVLLGGVSMYFMFDGVPLIPAHWLAITFSIALSTVSFSLWRMIQKGSKYDKWLMIVIAVITPLDLWIDLSFMEIVRGTGDVWLFLSPDALQIMPRPPLWWGFTILIGVITLVNEPLTAILTESMKRGDEWKKKYPSQKSKTASSHKSSGMKTYRTPTSTSPQLSGRPQYSQAEMEKLISGD